MSRHFPPLLTLLENVLSLALVLYTVLCTIKMSEINERLCLMVLFLEPNILSSVSVSELSAEYVIKLMRWTQLDAIRAILSLLASESRGMSEMVRCNAGTALTHRYLFHQRWWLHVIDQHLVACNDNRCHLSIGERFGAREHRVIHKRWWLYIVQIGHVARIGHHRRHHYIIIDW